MYNERNPKFEIDKNYLTSKEEHKYHIKRQYRYRYEFDMEEKYINEVVIPKLVKMDSEEIKNTLIKQIKNKRGDWEIIGFVDNNLEYFKSLSSRGMYYDYLDDYQYDTMKPRLTDYQLTDDENKLIKILDGMTQKEYNVYIKRFRNSDGIVDTRGIEESLLKEVK